MIYSRDTPFWSETLNITLQNMTVQISIKIIEKKKPIQKPPHNTNKWAFTRYFMVVVCTADSLVPVNSSEEDPKVFISYQWDMQSKVDEIRSLLERSGFPCWVDVGMSQPRGHSSRSSRSSTTFTGQVGLRPIRNGVFLLLGWSPFAYDFLGLLFHLVPQQELWWLLYWWHFCVCDHVATAKVVTVQPWKQVLIEEGCRKNAGEWAGKVERQWKQSRAEDKTEKEEIEMRGEHRVKILRFQGISLSLGPPMMRFRLFNFHIHCFHVMVNIAFIFCLISLCLKVALPYEPLSKSLAHLLIMSTDMLTLQMHVFFSVTA